MYVDETLKDLNERFYEEQRKAGIVPEDYRHFVRVNIAMLKHLAYLPDDERRKSFFKLILNEDERRWKNIGEVLSIVLGVVAFIAVCVVLSLIIRI